MDILEKRSPERSKPEAASLPHVFKEQPRSQGCWGHSERGESDRS